MNEVDVEAPNGERSHFDLSNSVHGDHTSMESDEELSDYEDDDDDDEPTINTEAARKKFKNMKQTGSNTVYAVLALAAIGFSLATFFLLKSANEKKFKSEVRKKTKRQERYLCKYAGILTQTLAWFVSSFFFTFNHFAVSKLCSRDCGYCRK